MRKLKVGDKFIDDRFLDGGIAVVTGVWDTRYEVLWSGLDFKSGGRDVDDPDLREITPLDELL